MRFVARYPDEYDDEAEGQSWGRPRNKRKPKRTQAEVLAELVEPEVNNEGQFNPTFSASRHERQWILTYLTKFYDDHLITDVLRQVKGGKEANVYCCEAHPTTGVALLAAKLYRPREFRHLRNDAMYRQGRAVLDDEGKLVRNDRMLHAVAKGSSFGKELSHTSWLAHEYETLQQLHQAGADVPKPWAIGQHTIIMEYFGTAEMAAPTLHQTRLQGGEARRLFERLIHNLDIMVAHGRVHGDLSAYNILYWEGEAIIIDFPQAVDIYTNQDAFHIFRRDVERLCEGFSRYFQTPHPARLATRLWRKYIPEDNFEALNLLASHPDEDDRQESA